VFIFFPLDLRRKYAMKFYLTNLIFETKMEYYLRKWKTNSWTKRRCAGNHDKFNCSEENGWLRPLLGPCCISPSVLSSLLVFAVRVRCGHGAAGLAYHNLIWVSKGRSTLGVYSSSSPFYQMSGYWEGTQTPEITFVTSYHLSERTKFVTNKTRYG